MIPKSGYRFRKRSCSNKKLARSDDSRRRHPALVPIAGSSALADDDIEHVGRVINMPELPEVETVRRGLEPVMEGARFTKVEAHRRDLRWPLPKDFVARLEGQTVAGLGR